MKNELNKDPLEKVEIVDLEQGFAQLASTYEYMSTSTLQSIKQQIVSQQIPAFKSYANGIGPCALTVFDIEEQRFLYVDDDIEKISGIPKEHYFNKGIKYLFSRLAYDNIPYLIKSTYHERQFLKKIPTESYADLIVNREYAYREKGSKRWILQQIIRHLVNDDGSIFAIVTLQINIDHIKCDNKFRYYIYNRRLNEIVYPKKKKRIPLDVTLNVLSAREREIVELISLGFSNQQIADKLFISYHTVRTHRKNIFKKLGCSSVLDLVRLINNH
ncbi:helix-turn-helix transcriptional regulator [Spongiivirga sp. MCCC 1A20706]|uniref:response regulator transcription factor n=1 Tax=Spongiivirga sp. MCCC 1A20706 TaxID=3160963 RepID=UPI0039776A49